MKKVNGVSKAVQSVGGRRALAEAVNVTRQAVEQWLKAGEVPPRKAGDVAKVTGVELHELNSIFPHG